MAELLPSSSCELSELKIQLEDEELWNYLHAKGHEMIVSKEGRLLFPFLGIQLSGLKEFNQYKTIIYLVPADPYFYKYKRGNLIITGQVVQETSHPILLETTFQYAEYWTRPVYIKNDKLTTDYSKKDEHGYVFVESRRRYNIEVHVEIMPPSDRRLKKIFKLPLTEFLTVTKFHNPVIAKKKGETNPYASMRNKQ